MENLYRDLFPQELRKGEKRRIEILKSAIRVLVRDGAENLNFNTIAKESKLGRAHISYYFSSIADIMNATLRFVITTAEQTTNECMKKAKTPEDQLRCFIRGVFLWFEKYPEQVTLMLLHFYRTRLCESTLEVHTEIRENRIELLEEILLRMNVPHPQSFELARLIQNLMLGAVIYSATTKNAPHKILEKVISDEAFRLIKAN